MAGPPHNQFCPPNIGAPNPVGFCDRCGFEYPLGELVFQYDWRGASLSNLQLRVCTRTCYDVPQDQLRPIIIGPDPVPLRDPRPGWWQQQENASAPVQSTGPLGGYGMGAWSLGPYSIGSIIPPPDFIE